MPEPSFDDPPFVVDDAPPAASTTLQRVPVTLDHLAARGGEALEILEARIVILETARKRAIRITSPEDWVLFKSPDDRVTGYLQDAGCDRARDILGIEIYNVTTPERIAAADGQSFMYVIRGDGRSRLTLQHVEAMEGGRTSVEDFCKGKTGAELELLVRKAARANLDGNISRELMGLKTVPLTDLVAAWEGTKKDWNHCRKGRGFGTADERYGATRAGEPDVPPPTCPVCPAVNGVPVALKYRAAKDGRGAFYGCPNYAKHPANAKRVGVDAADWIAKQTAAANANTASAMTAEEHARLDAELAAEDAARATGRPNGR